MIILYFTNLIAKHNNLPQRNDKLVSYSGILMKIMDVTEDVTLPKHDDSTKTMSCGVF